MNRGPSPAAVHSSISLSPSEFPKAKSGRRPMKLDADRLSGVVVDQLDLRELHQDRLPVRAGLQLEAPVRADDLLGRDAVDALGEDAHELDPAARDDEGLEAVRAEVIQQLAHRD